MSTEFQGILKSFAASLKKYNISLDGELSFKNKSQFVTQLKNIDLQQALEECLNLLLRQLPLTSDISQFKNYLFLLDKLLEAKIIVASPKEVVTVCADERAVAFEKLLSLYPLAALKKLIALQEHESAELSQGRTAYILCGLVSTADFIVAERMEIQLDLNGLVQAGGQNSEQANGQYSSEYLQASLSSLYEQFKVSATLTLPNLRTEKLIKDKLCKNQKHRDRIVKGKLAELTEEQRTARLYLKREEVAKQCSKVLAITPGLKKQVISLDSLQQAYATELNVKDEILADLHIHALLQNILVGESHTGLGIFQTLQNGLNQLAMAISDPTMEDNSSMLLVGDPLIRAEPVAKKPGAVFYKVKAVIARDCQPIGELNYGYIIDADKQFHLSRPTFIINGLTEDQQGKLMNGLRRELGHLKFYSIDRQQPQHSADINKRLSSMNYAEFTKVFGKLQQEAKSKFNHRLSRIDYHGLNELLENSAPHVSVHKPELGKVGQSVKPVPQTRPAESLSSTFTTVGACTGGIIGGGIGIAVGTALIFNPAVALIAIAGCTFGGAAIGAGVGKIVARVVNYLSAPPTTQTVARKIIQKREDLTEKQALLVNEFKASCQKEYVTTQTLEQYQAKDKKQSERQGLLDSLNKRRMGLHESPVLYDIANKSIGLGYQQISSETFREDSASTKNVI